MSSANEISKRLPESIFTQAQPKQSARERLLDAGYDDVVIFDGEAYADALIGVDTENRAIYDYERMIEGLVLIDGMSEDEAIEWIDYNVIRSLPYVTNAPIIVYPL